MALQPCPSEARSHASDPTEDRNFYCASYSVCLDHAVTQRWEHWTCRRCPLEKAPGIKPRAKDFAHDRRRGTD